MEKHHRFSANDELSTENSHPQIDNSRHSMESYRRSLVNPHPDFEDLQISMDNPDTSSQYRDLNSHARRALIPAREPPIANFPVFYSMARPSLNPNAVIRALSNPIRWRILRELARGEALPVVELSSRLKVSQMSLGKHAFILHQAGLLERGYGLLYRIPKALEVPEQPLSFDVGIAVIRLDWMDAPR
jgi:hypothetical protein